MNLFALKMTEPAVYIPGKSVLTTYIYYIYIYIYGCMTRKGR